MRRLFGKKIECFGCSHVNRQQYYCSGCGRALPTRKKILNSDYYWEPYVDEVAAIFFHHDLAGRDNEIKARTGYRGLVFDENDNPKKTLINGESVGNGWKALFKGKNNYKVFIYTILPFDLSYHNGNEHPLIIKYRGENGASLSIKTELRLQIKNDTAFFGCFAGKNSVITKEVIQQHVAEPLNVAIEAVIEQEKLAMSELKEHMNSHKFRIAVAEAFEIQAAVENAGLAGTDIISISELFKR